MLLKAIVLGIVQGLTEFIPVSSSGHLIATRYLLGWHEEWLDQTFDVALHLGTLVAVLVYFRADWRSILSGFANRVTKRVHCPKEGADGGNGRLLMPILVACVPAAIAGYLWEDFIEAKLGQWYMIVAALVIVGLVMLLAEKMGKKRREMDQMNYSDFLTIGFAQALALFPGVSRSGITISAGLFRNIDRAAAARFSFLLSTPIIFGAGMKKMLDMVQAGISASEMLPIAVGFVAAGLSGYLAIHFLLSYLRTRTLTAFVVYRIVFAGALAAVMLTR